MWWPALTPNGRYWFNGQRWVRWRNGDPSRGGLSYRGMVWLLWCAAWLPVDTVLLRNSGFSAAAVLAAALVAVVGLAALPAGGFVLARDREPWRFWYLCWVGTAANLVGYVVAMTFSNDPGQDDAAGAGLVLLFAPVAVVVAVLIAIGLGLGAIRYRRRTR